MRLLCTSFQWGGHNNDQVQVVLSNFEVVYESKTVSLPNGIVCAPNESLGRRWTSTSSISGSIPSGMQYR